MSLKPHHADVRESDEEEPSTELKVEPLTVGIGAEIKGIDLSEPLSDATVAAIRTTLIERKVVFLRDQVLSGDEQVRFASRLGILTAAHPTMPSLSDQKVSGATRIYELDGANGGRADHWHTDVTYTVRPPAISVLRSIEVPEIGGDTQWANTEAGYARLPAPLKHLASELRVVHTNAYDYGRALKVSGDGAASRQREQFESIVFETEHPLVREHPESGRRALLLGGFAQQIVDLPAKVSADLIAIFQSYVLRPEHIVRWRWRRGDVAIWDNRGTQHYAVNDYSDAARKVQRVTVAGEVPVGLDGRPSRALRGDDRAYMAASA